MARSSSIDLSSLIKLDGYHSVEVDATKDSNSYYINICRPLSTIEGKQCSVDAAICREDGDGNLMVRESFSRYRFKFLSRISGNFIYLFCVLWAPPKWVTVSKKMLLPHLPWASFFGDLNLGCRLFWGWTKWVYEVEKGWFREIEFKIPR